MSQPPGRVSHRILLLPWQPRPHSHPASVHVYVQVQLSAQVQVEEGVHTEQEEQDGHDDQQDILSGQRDR